MRGDANTKRCSARTGLYRGLGKGLGAVLSLGLAFTLASCDPFGFKKEEEEALAASYKGHAAVSWTLNGAPLTAQSCTTERITSMNVFVASRQDREQNVEFTNTTCGLDRFSMAMIPSGAVRVFVDAVREVSGQDPCVRYSGQVDLSAGSSFPSQATPVVLKLVANCP